MAKNKCSLLPYKLKNVLSLQDASQKSGWFITAFNLPDCWKHTSGNGVRIAVLDTGCDLEHPDLLENLEPGVNFINLACAPIDDCGHGTHATGIICAGNN